jgi:protein-S-isoprenylcysteine O-methyltransferase Ste14
MTYDLLLRLPLLVWALFCTVKQLAMLTTVDAGHIAMRLPTITFMLLVAAVVILRSRPSTKASGLEPRISALVGSFVMYSIVFFPRRELSLTLEMISTVLTFIGTAGAVVALGQLGRSFSVMAETRQLVTSGPYRLVRHPLYLAEQIAIIGVFIQYASVWTGLLLAVQIAFQLRRMQNEETILTASFPEYIEYRQTTARLIPGVY